MIVERKMLVFPFYVCGRMWPLFREIVWACFGRFYCLSGLAVGGFESLTALRGFYIYDGCFISSFFLSRLKVNMSFRLIFNSDETFNLLVHS